MSSQLTTAIDIDKQLAHLSSYTSKCRFGCRLLYYINYCYIMSELCTKLKITAYLTKVDTLQNNG